MHIKFLKYWDRVRSSFWFLPATMGAAAAALAQGSVALDQAVAHEQLRIRQWVYTGDAEGASAVLTAISGSMITIVGLVFSMTLVTLSLAASSFGPRLLQNFMKDKTNQLVLGTFVATFLYCLLVLRTIRGGADPPFVPQISVTVGVLLALASLGVLIYFIHHIALSIQADHIIKRVGSELIEHLESIFPEQIGEEGPAPIATPAEAGAPENFAAQARPIGAQGDGYLQLVDAEVLMRLATDSDVLLQLERRPGQYVLAGDPLALVWPGERLDEGLACEVNEAFVLGDQRTATQDFEHVVGQLVEIAVRSLSPSTNDPFTAITCIDRLGSAFRRLAMRQIPSPYRYDQEGRLRVVAPVATFPALLEAAFDPIRHYGIGSRAVVVRLLSTLGSIAVTARRSEDRAALQYHAEVIAGEAREALPQSDRARIAQAYEATVAQLAAKGAGSCNRAPSPPAR